MKLIEQFSKTFDSIEIKFNLIVSLKREGIPRISHLCTWYRRTAPSNRYSNDHNVDDLQSSCASATDYEEVRACGETMLKLSPVEALDYAAALEDAAEELHILGKLVPPHYQYTESADEVRLVGIDH